jgi:hypothetical protein
VFYDGPTGELSDFAGLVYLSLLVTPITEMLTTLVSCTSRPVGVQVGSLWPARITDSVRTQPAPLYPGSMAPVLTHTNSSVSAALQIAADAQQAKRVDIQSEGDPLDCPECQIPLTSFKTADVGTVPSKQIGKGLLREAAGPTVCLEVHPDDPLEVPFGHGRKGAVPAT